MPITSPVRPSDFVNSENAKLEWVEELCAIGRIAPSSVEPFSHGYGLRLIPPARFRRWWLNRTAVDHHFGLDSSVVDRFGTTVQVSRQMTTEPCELYAAVTSWRDVREAAQYLRTKSLKNAYDGDAVVTTEKFITIITETLRIPERPANSPLLPAWTQVKWGALTRLDRPTVDQVLDYLLLELPAEGKTSPLVPLGGGVVSIVAHSPSSDEPVQIGIANHWADDLLVKTLNRWLRGFEPSPAG